MQRKLLLASALVMIVLAGIISGFFVGPMQKELTLTQSSGSPGMQATTRKKSSLQSGENNQSPTITILAQDTFKRPDQKFWGTASDGRQWQGDANIQQAFSIVNATGQVANVQGSLNAVLGVPVENVDVMASGSVNQFAIGVNWGVVLRWTDADNWYKVLIDGQNLALVKRVNGQTQQLLTLPFTAQAGRVYKLRFRAIGAVLFAKAWPGDKAEPVSWMLTTSDSALMTGQAGLRMVTRPDIVMNLTSFTMSPATLGNDL